VPGFGDVCVIALQLGWPLLYFATGTQRTGDDDRSLVAHLQFWGLRDIRTPEPVLLGEARPFEELLAKVVSRPINQRVLAALPALLLRNAFDAHRLISAAEGYGSLQRVGWLADIASYVSARLPVGASQPDAQSGLSIVAQTAASALHETSSEKGEFAYLGTDPSASKAARLRTWEASPPLTRRWRIACDIGLDEFVTRARSVLVGT